ncbi:MAG: HAD hydrolase-like protein, partial [Staphylococcus epidermidis]|nr:HAD hydrolase-like protein [Staphylococcus epidermidis]
KAIQSAFKRLNLDEPTEQAILHTYHLNLYNNFKTLASHELSFYQIEKLIDEYHRCFSNDEIHQSREYTGISEALQFLHNQKKKIFVVSNKETLTTQRYLDYLGLSRFITDSLGVCIKNEDKLLCEMIQNLIQKHHLMVGKTVYIGDTAQDIKNANQAHVQTCAVTWGAQSAHELLHENPHYVVNDPEELLTIL